MAAAAGVIGGVVGSWLEHQHTRGVLLFGREERGPVVEAVLIGVLSIANATAEEVTWRSAGSYFHPLSWPFGLAAVSSTLSFSLAHVVRGAPSGIAAMPFVALYGAALIGVYRRFGLPLSILTHTLTDAIILWRVGLPNLSWHSA